MFCPKCGNQIEDNEKFCSHCGATTQEGAQAPFVQQAPVGFGVQNTVPMAWFKFLIYFSLFAGAVVNVISGIMVITGAHYNGAAEFVYAFFGGLQVLDIIVGVLMLAVAGFAVYTRMRLAGYYTNGPKMLMYCYIASAAVSLLYIIGLYVVVPGIGEFLNLTSYIASLVVSVVMVIVNKIYFDKRQDLFVNN